MSERSTPVFGGVQDGGTTIVPNGAQVNSYTKVLRGEGKGHDATTEYVLRESGKSRAMVAKGLKWPILEAVAPR